jgi:hypothetical protein
MEKLKEAPQDIVPPTTGPIPQIVNRFCDSCGTDDKGNYVTRAYYFAVVNGSTLSYCVHHANEYEVKLLSVATKVYDLRYLMAPGVN